MSYLTGGRAKPGIWKSWPEALIVAGVVLGLAVGVVAVVWWLT